MLSETFGSASDGAQKRITTPSSVKRQFFRRKRKRPGRIISSVRACINVSRSSRAASRSLSSKAPGSAEIGDGRSGERIDDRTVAESHVV